MKSWRKRLAITGALTVCAAVFLGCGHPETMDKPPGESAAKALTQPVAYAADAGVHVDQVGYLTGYTKKAMVTAGNEDKFLLVNAASNQTVFEGQLSPALYDNNSGENIRCADFTAFNTPGTYRLVVGSRASEDFAIGDNVYAVPLAQTLRSFTLSRSNTPMRDDITSLVINQGHPQTANAEVYFSDQINRKGDRLDVSGGWYDAGDYGKYVTTGAIASAELLLAYEANPAHFTAGQLFFPSGVSSDGRMPDILNEVKWELDWMRKMQRADGSVFHKVAGANWPGFDVTPDSDTQPFYIYGNATSPTAMYGAALAIAARVYKPFDEGYAATLLDRAKFAWQFLSQHQQPFFRQDGGQDSGSGPYGKQGDIEERVWLAAELFKTTGDKTYENYLKDWQSGSLTQRPRFFSWDNCLALAQYAYLTTPGADATLRERTKQSFLSYADEICQKIAHDGFNCALAREDYTWASTKNALSMGDVLLMANAVEPKREYVEGALAQIHYLFGRNALNKSFMTGVGKNPPEHPHNRIHMSTGVYVPGLVVGGPNAVSGGDPDQSNYLSSGNIPPAKAYLDVLMSWSTNEYAIDYTAAAAYALAWFTKADPNVKADDLKLKRAFPR